MKKVLFLFLFFICIFSLINAQKQRTYITLDTSGSMVGEKFVYSNYTAQFISLLNHENDVFLIINGVPKKLSGEKNFYKKLQINQKAMLSGWGMSKLGTQIGDIAAFNQVYETIPQGWQYLYIIGDGDWDTFKYKNITDKFLEIYGANGLKVFLISYGNEYQEATDFVEFLKERKIAKILNTSMKPQSVMNNTLKILAFAKGGKSKITTLSQVSPKSIRVKTEQPALRFFALYQDETDDKNLPKLVSADQGNTAFDIVLMGNPSTTNVYTKDPILLSGALWSVSGEKRFEAGDNTVLNFDRNIKINNLKVLAVYEPESEFVTPHTRSVKDAEEENIKRKRIRTGDSIAVQAKKNGVDSAKIPVTRYMKEKNTYLVKNGIKKESAKKYTVKIDYEQKIDSDSVKLEVEQEYPMLIKNVSAKTEGKTITLHIETHGRWVDHFLPDTIKLKAALFPKNKKNAVKTAKDKFDINVVKTEDKRYRSSWTFFLTIPVVIYLFALTHKARFKKGAKVKYDFEGKNTEVTLREKGFGKWLNRWLNPFFSEQREVVFTEIDKTIRFIATRNRKNIMFDKRQFGENSMKYVFYDPYSRKRMIFFEENAPIVIHHPKKGIATVFYDRVKSIMNDVLVFRFCLLVAATLLLLFFII